MLYYQYYLYCTKAWILVLHMSSIVMLFWTHPWTVLSSVLGSTGIYRIVILQYALYRQTLTNPQLKFPRLSDPFWADGTGNCGLFLWRITPWFAINPHSSELCHQFGGRLELLNLRVFGKKKKKKWEREVIKMHELNLHFLKLTFLGVIFYW